MRYLLSLLVLFVVCSGASAARDRTPPSVPGNLHQTASTETSISIAWNASTDNVGVAGYNKYRDGSLIADNDNDLTHTFSVASWACGQSHVLGVAARDAAGNLSTRANITATTSDCAPPPPPPPPTPIWADEFNSVAGEPSADWAQRRACPDQSLRDMCFDPQEVSVDGLGNLVLGIHQGRCPTATVGSYCTGDARTATLAWGAGTRFEARIKMPAGTGLGGSFWHVTPATTNDDELDTQESKGSDLSLMRCTEHWRSVGVNDTDTLATGLDLTVDYHIYALDLYSDHYVMSVDGLTCRSSPNLAPADAFNVILTTYVGQCGTGWWGCPDANTVLPSAMLVDYVRVYALS